MSKDKGTVLHVISDAAQTEVTDPESCHRILFVDGMVAVN